MVEDIHALRAVADGRVGRHAAGCSSCALVLRRLLLDHNFALLCQG